MINILKTEDLNNLSLIDINKIKNLLNNVQYINNIPENINVFFTKEVNYPRKEFLNNYPKNKICKKSFEILIIAKKQYIGYNLKEFEELISKWLKGNTFYSLKKRIIFYILFYNICYNNNVKYLIDFKNLKINNDSNNEIMTENTFNNLKEIIGSSNGETVNLALKLIYNYNLEINFDKITLLFLKMNRDWEVQKFIKKTQKLKFITEKIKSIYPGYK